MKNLVLKTIKNYIKKNNTKEIVIDNEKTNLTFDFLENDNEFIIEINVSNKFLNNDKFIINNNKTNLIFDNNLKHIATLQDFEKKYIEVLEFDNYKYLITNKDLSRKVLPYDINYFNINNENLEIFLVQYFDKIILSISNYYKKINYRINKLIKNDFLSFFKLKNLTINKFNSFLKNDFILISIYDKKLIYFNYSKELSYFLFFNNCFDNNELTVKNCNKYLVEKVNQYLKVNL